MSTPQSSPPLRSPDTSRGPRPSTPQSSRPLRSADTSRGPRREFTALTRAQWFGFWREKQNWFWLMAFPMMFMVLFGFLFRDVGASKPTLAVVGEVPFVSGMPSDAREQFDELFEISEITDPDEAREAVRKGDLDGALSANGPTGLTLEYSAADQVVAATLQGTVQGFVQTANVVASGNEPAFALETQQVEDQSLKPIQFLAPGLLGWAVAMGATFNTALPMVAWRTSQLLRRLRLSPVRPLSLVTSRLVVCLTVALAQTAIFLGVGTTFFGLKLTGTWWLALPLILLATVAFMAIGMVAGAFSKTEEGASGLANMIVLPMAFLSGSFIPLENAPDWLTTIAKFLPLGQLNEGMIDVMVRGEGVGALAIPAIALTGFTIVFGAVAAKVFRWEDRAG